MLTVGSLFSGIGGLDLGYERAGFTVVWQCEQEPFCRAALAKLWPGVPCYMDVRAIHAPGICGGICENCVRPVDVLIGGFPCQDVSDAGKREGISGARSGLWKEYARLIRELRAHGLRGVGIENVTGLFVRGFEDVLRDLAKVGFDAEWEVVRASDVGAPHRRARIFIVAYPQQNTGGDEQQWIERWPAGDGQEPREASARGLADASSGRQRITRDATARDYTQRPNGSSASPMAYANRDGCGRLRGQTGSWAHEPEQRPHVARCSEGLADAASDGYGISRRARRDRERSPRRHALEGDGARPPFGTAGFWPARPGEPQHPWEPSRCLESSVGARAHGVPGGLAGWRRASLQATGNAVVPQCAEIQARRLRAILERGV